MKKVAIVLVVVMLCGILFVACGKTEAEVSAVADKPETVEGEAASAALPGEGEVYALILSLHQLEFFDATKGGVCDAANELGATWYFAGPQEFDPALISQAIDQAVANKVTGIVLHGQAQETAAAVDNAIAAGIPVICVNTDIESDRLAFLGCNPYNVGYNMGMKLAELLDGKTGSVILSTNLSISQPSSVQNMKGSRDALEQFPGIKIIEVDDLSDINVAATNIGAALQANSDVVGVIGHQSISAAGACTAIREAGKTGDIVVLGRERDAATLECIKSGEIACAYLQNTYVETYIATKWLHDYVNGNFKVVNDYIDYGMNPIPPIVDSGSGLITKDNVELFEEKYEWEITAKN